MECARGKVVGGCSSTNAMAYVRGNRGDFERWKAGGLTGWGYDDALPYFRKQESWEGGGNAYRGGDGPLGTQTCKYQDPLLGAFADAAKAVGHGWTDDYNAEKQEGFGRLQMTIRNGRRASTATAYLRPALRRPNLDHRNRGLGHPRTVRGQSRHRHRIPPGRRDQDRARRKGSDPRRRRHQHAADC